MYSPVGSRDPVSNSAANSTIFNVFSFQFFDQIRRELVANSIHTIDVDATQLSSRVASASEQPPSRDDEQSSCTTAADMRRQRRMRSTCALTLFDRRCNRSLRQSLKSLLRSTAETFAPCIHCISGTHTARYECCTTV